MAASFMRCSRSGVARRRCAIAATSIRLAASTVVTMNLMSDETHRPPRARRTCTVWLFLGKGYIEARRLQSGAETQPATPVNGPALRHGSIRNVPLPRWFWACRDYVVITSGFLNLDNLLRRRRLIQAATSIILSTINRAFGETFGHLATTDLWPKQMIPVQSRVPCMPPKDERFHRRFDEHYESPTRAPEMKLTKQQAALMRHDSIKRRAHHVFERSSREMWT